MCGAEQRLSLYVLLLCREPQQSSVTAEVAGIEEKLEDMGVTTLKPIAVDVK